MAVRDTAELKNDIMALKQSVNTAVLVHSYQDPDLADVADGVGDCVDLALALRRSSCPRAVVCGVRYVAETVALLCPDREIILAHPQARCPMSGQVYHGRVRSWREEHPDTCVVCMVQFGAKIKAECDLCITGNNALQVLSASNARRVLLLADNSFGRWLSDRLPEKEFELWPCSCPAMTGAQASDVELCRVRWPQAKVAANGSLRQEVTALADMSGSTSEIIDFCRSVEEDVIVADEVSVCSYLRKLFPERSFMPVAPSKLICNNMKLTDLETLERALSGGFGMHVTVDPSLQEKALAPVLRMLEMTGIHDFS